MNCPTCGQINPDDSKFCRGCGTRFADTPPPTSTGWECAACHYANREGARFCTGCGASAAPAPIEAPAAAAAAATVAPLAPLPVTPNEPAALAANCPKCNAPRLAGARFCKVCGQPFDIALDTPPVDFAPTPTPTPTPAPVPSPAPTTESVANMPPPTGAKSSPASDDVTAPPTRSPQRPAPATTNTPRGSRTLALAAGIVVLVVAIGALVAWQLLRNDGTAPAMTTTPAVTASSALAVSPPRPVPTPATEPSVAAPVPLPAPAASQLAASAAKPAQTPLTGALVPPPESPPVSIPAQARAPLPVPKALPATVVRAPAPVAGPSMNQIATKLVRKGEQAYDKQDYSTAIANAKAALEMNPDDTRASHLLQQAQQAQQNAVNRISIQ